jgi:glutaredoxin
MLLYTTGCSKCKILESKLNEKEIKYEVCEDKELMKSKGFRSVPVLELDDGTILTYGKAVKYVNNWEDNQ